MPDFVVLTNKPSEAVNYDYKKVYADCLDESEAIKEFMRECRCEDVSYRHKCNVYRVDDPNIKNIIADWEKNHDLAKPEKNPESVTVDDLLESEPAKKGK